MTYGEFDRSHVVRPSGLALVAVSTALIIIGVIVGGALLSLTHLFTSEISLSGGRPLFVPFAQSPLLPPSPMASAAAVAYPPTIVIALVAIVLFFWPDGRSLASRLAVPLLSTGMAVSVLGLALESSDGWLEADLSLGAIWRPASFVVAIVLLLQAERRSNQILGNFVSVDTPLQRIRTWALRLSLPLGMVAAIAYFSEYDPLAWAALVTLAMTLFFAVAIRHPEQFEATTRPEMREAAAVLSILAVVFVAGSLWAFRSPLVGGAPRAVVIGGPKNLSFVEPAALRQAMVVGEQKAKEKKAAEADQKKKDESVIEIEWSKPKKKPGE
jgi:hypothetical protein